DPSPCLPAVELELCFTRSAQPDKPRPCAAGLLRKPGPEACQPREQVLILGQLHLELSFPRVRMLAEDVQDEPGPVDDPDSVTQRHFELLLLPGGELVVEQHELGAGV